MVVERRSPFALLAFWAGAVDRSLARFCAARTSALTNWSLRIECQPERPLFFAISAKSFQL
jgi:hypothetical protein